MTQPGKAPFVPWITAWSGETAYGVRPCKYVGNRLALWQPYAPGVGEPTFKSRHAVRARKAVIEGLCTVCGLAIPEGARWLFPRLKRLAQPGGAALYTLNEPPVHKECAELSMQLCPHVRREGWRAVPFNGQTGLVDVAERGATLNAALGTHAQPDASIIVGIYLTVSRAAFESLTQA